MPGFGVAVAVEHDALVLLDDVGKDGLEGLVEILAGFQVAFEGGGDVVEGFGHDGVEHRVGAGDGLAGGDGAELKLVAGEGEGRGAVAVAGIARELRQNADAQFHRAAVLGGGGGCLFQAAR